ncbi:MAG: DUF1330 domain-containing protein [Chloroflexi bacterium]|nr:DUF1330 domain-containing protein [Chloroflexota bacterium]MCI0776332.1 DUF1330 domain-containing protein [Chloroflexota bacterium]MCI0835351.1 DUF1330 domain-containing protein [Chloroflexota bacterium]MCI0850747.1 DUF1330 domain-containing protein [Chloroflexota bacterium]MCI0870823.1 DUF1330 domain-containing protein [Chloroflexota bacterium]
MAVYIVVDIDVEDQDAYEEYRKLVSPLIEKYGGRYIVRGGKITPGEGDWDLHRVVILEFPSAERATAMLTSDEYAPVAEIRRNAAVSKTFMVEGV